MRPQYLTPDTVDQLTDLFADESTLQLAEFLSDKFSQRLRACLEEADWTDPSAAARTAVKASGVARPPHKHRFLYRQPVFGATSPSGNAYEELIDVLFPSLAFKKWLSLATGLELTRSNVLGRRFRRGLDYTLATGYEDAEPQLEVCLGVTPSGGWDPEEALEGKEAAGRAEERMMWEDIVKLKESTLGGYEMYMAADDEEDGEGEDEVDADEHVANGGGAQKDKAGGKVMQQSSHTGAGNRPHNKPKKPKLDPAVYQSGTGDEEDGVLFSMPACWNSLSVVLRDSGVLRFVKYVSQAAKGDRWDVVGEFAVSAQDDESEDQAESGEEQQGEQDAGAGDDEGLEELDEDGGDDAE